MNCYFGGLAVDRNYKDKTEELSALLGRELAFDREITFEEACQEPEENSCNVYYTDGGTLIFLELKRADKVFYAQDSSLISFFITDIEAPSHFFNYVKGGELVCSRYVIDGVAPEPIAYQMITPQEELEDVSTNFIFETITELIGQEFEAIPSSATCYRYHLAKPVGKKPWWKFW